jgi:hypothetical protein
MLFFITKIRLKKMNFKKKVKNFTKGIDPSVITSSNVNHPNQKP